VDGQNTQNNYCHRDEKMYAHIIPGQISDYTNIIWLLIITNYKTVYIYIYIYYNN